jgi:hypothetical protein
MVVVTVLLLGANLYQIRKFSKTFLAETLLGFLNDYSSKEMRDSFDAITKFSAENPELIEQLRTIYFCCNRAKPLEEQHIETARGYVTKFEGFVGMHRSRIAWFFNKAWRLEKHGFINRRTLATICGLDGARIFIESVCPMTLAIRLAKIHQGDAKKFLRNPSVKWYTEMDKHIREELEKWR